MASRRLNCIEGDLGLQEFTNPITQKIPTVSLFASLFKVLCAKSTVGGTETNTVLELCTMMISYLYMCQRRLHGSVVDFTSHRF